MRPGNQFALCLLGAVLCVCTHCSPVFPYSALTHEAIVDSAWDSIEPLLRKHYAGATDEELRQVHAYTYGGCILQDMGYYPNGTEFFSNLMHYVRTGDFAAALLEEAFPIEEYAFALGALEHYVADQTGHARATNLSVPIEFPKLRRKYDSWVTYEDDPEAHLEVEFEFDVLQVARGRYTPDAHHAFIGFEVARKLLDRTFYKIYGLEVSQVLGDEDLAIGTYRHTVSEIIPRATKIAWELKKDEIEEAMPGIQRTDFVYMMPRKRYEEEWGIRYERAHPGWYEKFLAFVVRLLPKIGWFRVLAVKPLTPASERLFAESFTASVDRYRETVQKVSHAASLDNINLDTGKPVRAGTYALADQTYAQLVKRLRNHSFADVTPELRENILAFYSDLNAPIATKEHEEEWADLLVALSELRAMPPRAFVAAQPRAANAAGVRLVRKTQRAPAVSPPEP